MLILSDRREKFAQAMAAGAPILEAMKKAGFAPSRANGSRLKAKVQPRIDELLAERAPPQLDFPIPAGLDEGERFVLDELVRMYKASILASDTKLQSRLLYQIKKFTIKTKEQKQQPAPEPDVESATRPWTVPAEFLNPSGELDRPKLDAAIHEIIESIGGLPDDESIKRRAADRNSKLGIL
jgi:hypothetical protein